MRTAISPAQWQPRTHQHGMAPGERSLSRSSTPPFTAEALYHADAKPNEDETAVQFGCHFPGDMRKVLAIPRNW